MSTKREAFCQGMQYWYPPAADIPFSTELVLAEEQESKEAIELITYRNEAPISLWAWDPVWAMRKFRPLRQAQTAFERMPPEEHHTLIPFPLKDRFSYLDIKDPGELSGYIDKWKESFVHLTTHDPRHAAVLAATFATNKHWENREFAAQVLPSLMEPAPELTENLLTFLSEDPSKHEKVIAAAAESRSQLGLLNPDFISPPKPQERPAADEVQFLSFGRLFDVCLEIEIDGERYDDLRIQGAFSTAINHSRILNREEEFVHAQLLDPYPRVHYSLADTHDTFIDVLGLYNRLRASRQGFNAWWPSGQRLNQPMFASLFHSIQLLSRAVNIVLEPEEPLPVYPSIQEPPATEPDIELPPALAEHAKRDGERIADLLQEMRNESDS